MRLSLFATFVLVGCSGAISTPESPTDVQSALDAPNGGLDQNATAPYFGDADVKAVSGFISEGADLEDLTLATSKVQGAQSYHVALIWGHLPPARDAEQGDSEPSIMSWNGGVNVDAGAIGVQRVLRFDPGDGVIPRKDPQTVAFRSHTLPHVDGLYLRVVLPPNAKPALHFKTESLSTDIDLAALEKAPGGVARLEDGRNGLFWVGFPDDGCARGLLFGRWRKLAPMAGSFRGVVSDASGDGIGHVRGIWGRSKKQNDNLFFGKYIDEGGEHAGLFGGKYGAGLFGGAWGTRDPNATGVLEGYYSDGYERGDGRGVYLGRWTERCPR